VGNKGLIMKKKTKVSKKKSVKEIKLPKNWGKVNGVKF
jgi:hypothetical protein